MSRPPFDIEAPADWIHVADFTFPCVLGLLPWEARDSQRLTVSLSLNLDLEAAAGGDLALTVDYAALAEQVRFVAQTGRWLLLESLAAALARLALAPPAPAERRAPVERAVVRVTKPDVLGGRAVPSIELHRRRAAAPPARTAIAPGVERETLQQTRQTGAYRVHLAPGTLWTPPLEMVFFVVAGDVEVDGHASCPGETIARGQHGVRAGTSAPACLLATSRPWSPEGGR